MRESTLRKLSETRYAVTLEPDEVAEIREAVEERTEAIDLLADFGHEVAGSAGMIPDRLTVNRGCNHWYKKVLPFLREMGRIQ